MGVCHAAKNRRAVWPQKVGGNQGLETAQTVDWAVDRTLVTSLDRARISLQEWVGLAWRGCPLLVHPGSFAPTWLKVGWAEGLDSPGPWVRRSLCVEWCLVGEWLVWSPG